MAAVTGVNAITTAFVKDYGSNIEFLVQQMGSRLRNSVQIESFVGESAAFIEQVGEAVAETRTSRHADTPLNPIPMDRRWVFPTDKETAELIDKQDRLRLIIDPTSKFAMAQAMALGRAMDDEIVAQILGDNKTGQDAGTTVSFPAGNLIAAGGTGLTIDKLREIVRNMEENDVDFEMEDVTAVITPKMKENLLQTTEVTSSDFNTVKALVNGSIDSFMGFKFITSNRIPGATNYTGTVTPAANTERGLFYVNSGVGLGIWNDITTRIDERADKSYATQVYAASTFGATRLQEDKVFAADALNA